MLCDRSHPLLTLTPFHPYDVNQLYGFPPNVGAVGTAALLNVGTSLSNLLRELKGQGYSVGGSGFGLGPLDGGYPVHPLSVLFHLSQYFCP